MEFRNEHVAEGADDQELTADNLKTLWATLDQDDRHYAFHRLVRTEAEEFFLSISADDQAALLEGLGPLQKRSWIRLLAPDDAADLLQIMDSEERFALLRLLDEQTRTEIMALMAYAEDAAGGLMNPRYFRLRPDMTNREAISYIRAQAHNGAEEINYAYVLDAEQRLLGLLSFRELFTMSSGQRVRDIMRTDLVTVPEHMDQEEISRVFQQNDLMALPVVDGSARMKGIVAVDDIVDVVHEEATEDIQKLGAVEALDAPYLNISLLQMVRKRGVWLTVLFFGEMLTASAMAFYETEIEKAVVLALFIPLIISSGGNSGSQATTLIIRAMALQEVRLADWWRVFVREVCTGAALGFILGTIGLLRIVLWPTREQLYGPHAVAIGLTVSFSLVGVVLWGSVMGAMLPFLLKRIGLDPASSSAPFVATLVDVTGLILYFTMANLMLGGVVL